MMWLFFLGLRKNFKDPRFSISRVLEKEVEELPLWLGPRDLEDP